MLITSYYLKLSEYNATNTSFSYILYRVFCRFKWITRIKDSHGEDLQLLFTTKDVQRSTWKCRSCPHSDDSIAIVIHLLLLAYSFSYCASRHKAFTQRRNINTLLTWKTIVLERYLRAWFQYFNYCPRQITERWSLVECLDRIKLFYRQFKPIYISLS